MGCEKHMVDALIAANQLLELASKQGTDCGHDGCLLLDGILRDCGMQIRRTVAASEARLLATPRIIHMLDELAPVWPTKAVGAGK